MRKIRYGVVSPPMAQLKHMYFYTKRVYVKFTSSVVLCADTTEVRQLLILRSTARSPFPNAASANIILSNSPNWSIALHCLQF